MGKYTLAVAWLSASILSLGVPQPLFAQEKGRHAAIDKYLDSQTLAIAWIDIRKIDVDQLSEFAGQVSDGAARIIPADGQGHKEQLAQMRVMQQALLQNDVTRIYWIVELSSLADGAEAVVVPTRHAVSVVELLKSFAGGEKGGARFVQDGDVVVGGKPALVDALLKKEGNVSPDLTAALQNNDATHGLVALTPTPLTGALVTSRTVKSWAGADLISSPALAESLVSLKSISLETELPPAHAELRIAAQSAEAARKTAGFVNQLFQSRVPDLAKQLELATDGPNIVLKSDSLERSVALSQALAKLFGPDHTSAHMNNMKRIALALHNFISANGRLPPQALTDKAGKRLLSWRVLILPYLEEGKLYNQFHLDEPWDSEHNLKLAQSIPSVYNDASPQMTPPRTRIVAPLTADSAFGRPGEPIRLQDVHDGTSATIWLVQVDKGHAVVWTKPEDVTIDAQNPLGSILDADHSDRPVVTSLMDGSVHAMPLEFFKKQLLPLLSIQGGEVISFEEAK